MPEIQAEPSDGKTETMREGRTETERATLELAGEQNEEAGTSAMGKGAGKQLKRGERKQESVKRTTHRRRRRKQYRRRAKGKSERQNNG